MKRLIIILLALISTRCTKPDDQEQSVLISGCGTIFTTQTIYTTATPPVFVGVRYDINLDAPISGFTKAYFILNDVNNTPVVNQYTNGMNVCNGNIILY